MRVIICILIVSQIIFVSLLSTTAEANAQTLGDYKKGEQIKEDLLAWLDSINSLQCEYIFRQDDPSSGLWKEEEILYRWQGNKQFYKAITLDHNAVDDRIEPIGSLVTENLIDGKGTLLGYQNERVTGEVNRESFLFGNATRLLRHLLQKLPFEDVKTTSPRLLGLVTILSLPGTPIVLNKDGKQILMYSTQGEEFGGIGLNAHLDDENRIVAVDYVNRPLCPSEEQLQFTTNDVYDVVQKISSVVLGDYQLFNGIWFPCFIKEIDDEVTNASFDQFRPLRASAYRGEISYCEFYVRMMEGLQYEPFPGSFEIRLKNESVQINKEMNLSDFEIDFPPGTDLVDKGTHEVFRTAQETWLERHANLVIILIALGILGGITVAGWRYWLGKP